MSTRNAFTLIEVMIVMTIVVTVLAIAWPRMRGLAAKTQMREAAIEFKAACNEARDHAVRSGKPTYVRYKFGQSKFQLSDSDASDIQSSNVIQITPSPAARSRTDEDLHLSEEFELALGMVFDDPRNQHSETEEEFGIDTLVKPDKLADPAQLDVKDKLAVGESKLIDWTESEQITFFPEGRSTSAMVRVLASDNGDSIMLTIRGLTAGVTVGDVEKRIINRNEIQENKGPAEPPKLDSIQSEVVDVSR